MTQAAAVVSQGVRITSRCTLARCGFSALGPVSATRQLRPVSVAARRQAVEATTECRQWLMPQPVSSPLMGPISGLPSRQKPILIAAVNNHSKQSDNIRRHR